MSNPANRLPPEYDETLPRDYDPEFTSDISTKMRIPEKIAVNEDANNVYNRYAEDELKKVASMNVPDRIMVYAEPGSNKVPDLHLDLNPLLDKMPTSSYVGLDTPPRVLTLEDRPFPNLGDGQPVKQPQFEDDEDLLVVDNASNNVSFSDQNGYVQHTPPRHPGHLPVPDSVKSVVNFPITDMIAKFFRFPVHTGPMHIDHIQRDAERQELLLATPGEGLLIQQDGDDDLAQLRRQMAKLHRQVQHIQEENVKRSQREYVLYPVMLGYVLFQMVKWFMQQH